mgnify:CR=1 FL=1
MKITVNHIKDSNGGHNPTSTANQILKQALGEGATTGWHPYPGITLKALSSNYGYHENPLQGIQMTVGDYGSKTMRRVMIKRDGTIDLDDIKAKFAELKAIKR